MSTMSVPPGERYLLLDTRRRLVLSGREWTCLVLLLLPLLMASASKLDHTWLLPRGVGFRQHVGFATIFAITPLLLLLTSYVLERLVSALRQIDAYCVPVDEPTRQRITRLAENEIRNLTLNGQTRSVLFLIVLGFFFWFIWNVIHTVDPIPTYGHDVFDSWNHHLGFVVAKLYVLFALCGVWAIAVFVALQATYSMVSVLTFLRKSNALQINVFHPDNCGGTSCFGSINVAITTIYTLLFLVVVGMGFTHQRTYAVLNAGALGCTVFAFSQSFGAIYAIHEVLVAKRDECLQAISTVLSTQLVSAISAQPSAPFRSDLLAYRHHMLGMSTYPYARGAGILINGLRLVPLVVSIVTAARSIL